MKKISILLLLFTICVIFNNYTFAQAEYMQSSAEAVMEVSSGRLLYSHNEKEKLPMASTTKIVTAITIIENCDVNSVVEVGKETVGVEGSSVYLKEGDKFTVRDLLYGLMLRSGNDCAETLAAYCCGNIADFCKLMNDTAKKYGATEVTAVDISEKAIELVKENAALNGLDIKTEVADVFEKLREYRKDKRKFGVVVLDPPAFTKSADTVKEGYKGYKDVNINGLKLVEKGGYLVTCSCSQHLTLGLFLQMIKESVIESGVRAKLVEIRMQGKDHSTFIGYDESLYLKVAVIKVL